MPITDPEDREVVRAALLNVQICRSCNAKNPLNATKCRKCRSPRLRPKRRERAG